MIPLKDTIPSRRYPLLNTSLMLINVLAFFYEISLGPWLPALMAHADAG